MKSLQKNIIALVLFSLMLMPLLYAAYFLIKKEFIQHKMAEALKQGSLQTISILNNEVAWVEKGKELLIDGKLFDVKSYKQLNNKIEVTGLFDEQEDLLHQQLQKIEHNKNVESTTGNFILVSLLFQPFFTEANSASQSVNLFITLQHFLSKNIENLSSIYLGIIIPPPKTC